MSTPSLTPYTMTTVFGDAGSHRLDFNGELVRYYTTWEGDIEVSPNGLADLLNDAFAKGTDEGRRLALKALAPEAALSIALKELAADPSIMEKAREMVATIQYVAIGQKHKHDRVEYIWYGKPIEGAQVYCRAADLHPDSQQLTETFNEFRKTEPSCLPPIVENPPGLPADTPERRAAMKAWADERCAPVTLPWSSLTEGAKDSIRDAYRGWGESEFAAHMWTKHTSRLFDGDMCIWCPAEPHVKAASHDEDIKGSFGFNAGTASASQPPIYPITLTRPELPCWLYYTIDRRWVHRTKEDRPDFQFYSHYSPDAPNPPQVKP